MVLSVVTATYACSGSDDDGPSAPNNNVSTNNNNSGSNNNNNSANNNNNTGSPATIGAGGGTAASDDDAAQVTIPAGALNQETAIEVTEVSLSSLPPAPAGLTFVGPAFAFTPHGTMFDAPVAIAVPYATSGSGMLNVLRLDDENDTSWETLPGPTFMNGVASISVTTFSVLAVAEMSESNPEGIPPDPDPIVASQFDGQGVRSNLLPASDPRFGVYASLCEWLYKCSPRGGAGGFGSLGSSTVCLVQLLQQESRNRGFIGGLDFAASQRCIDDAIATCSPILGRECFIPRTVGASEDECCDGLEGCVEGLNCVGAQGATGTCEPLPRDGESCSRTGTACAQGFVCDTESGETCRPVVGLNAPCGRNIAVCDTGLRCGTTCQPRTADGQTCRFTAMDQCLEASFCGLTTGGVESVCTPLNSRQEGEYCPSSIDSRYCAAGLVCLSQRMHPTPHPGPGVQRSAAFVRGGGLLGRNLRRTDPPVWATVHGRLWLCPRPCLRGSDRDHMPAPERAGGRRLQHWMWFGRRSVLSAQRQRPGLRRPDRQWATV